MDPSLRDGMKDRPRNVHLVEPLNQLLLTRVIESSRKIEDPLVMFPKTHKTIELFEMDPWEEKVAFVRKHYEEKGYRVHSGLQFGCELVLYADDPQRVHSDFCIHVVRDGSKLDWREIQTLVRSMPDLHKTLILANVIGDIKQDDATIQELAMATEHAPFRHRQKLVEVGSQRKRQKQV